MFKKQSWVILIILILVIAVFLYENRKLNSTLDTLENEVAQQKTMATQSQSASPEATPATSPTSTHVGETPTESAALNFSAWFSNEASALETSVPGQEEREADLKIKASQLSPQEINFLKVKATDAAAKANERIMATYLLSLGTGATQEALVEITKTPLSLSSPQPAHSLGETQLMHEKSLRVMAIDELFERAKTDAALRKSFQETIQKIQDPGLKQYALKKYRELK